MRRPFHITDAVLLNQEETKMSDSKCKICRRAGEKLFLKGAKCTSPKCPIVRRPYAPGFQGKSKRRKYLSEYGKQLKEKQKLRNFYNLKERSFKKYVNEAISQRGKVEDSREFFVRSLEKRLDNVVTRLGFCSSRAQARQLVGHGHFKVNGRKVNIPSYSLEVGDQVSLKQSSKSKGAFRELQVRLKNYEPPSWLKMDVKKMQGEVLREPGLEDVSLPAEISTIFEYYSR